MRIGLNLLYLLPGIVGGTETYAAGLLQGLAEVGREDEFIVFLNQESADWPLPQSSNFVRIVCPVRAGSRRKRYLFEQVRLPGLLRKHQVDVAHSLGYVAPLFTPCPSVVTVLDLNYRVFGNQMSVPRHLALNFFVGQSARRADQVVTISRFSRSQILTLLRVPSSKVSITCLANKPRQRLYEDPFVLTRRLGIESPYIVAFSSQSPHKNIPRLLRAFALAKERYELPHELVLVGHRPTDAGLAPGEPDEGVHFTGYLDEPSLEAVLRGAQILAFPSTYEGFGLPVLEAMAAGVPVVCSNAAALPEVAGEAAVYFDPLAIEDIAHQIALVALDSGLQAQLRQKGFENCRRFSWEKAAQETRQIYHDVIRRHSQLG
jgi:glycosyltransferase involved in cell wall biosynthesis